MVIIAPSMAPTEKNPVSASPSTLMKVESARDELRQVGEAQHHRGVDRPAERLHQEIHVAPHLGVEAARAGVEHADHGPVAAREAHRAADLRALEAVRDGAADDDLRRAGPEQPARDEVDLRPQLERARRDAADDDVRGPRGAGLGERDEDQHLLRHQRPAVRPERDRRVRLDHVRLQPRDAALDLGLRAAADRHHVVFLAGRHQRGLQPRVEHQHRGEDEHHQREAAGGQRGGEAPRPQVARDVAQRDGHVS
jgi:hypothetical protein